MAAKRKDDSQHTAPVIRVAPLGELRVYMVTEEELNIISRGSPGSVLSNFALALLPLAAAFLITLLSTTINSVAALVFFVCACLTCLIAGLICLALWWQHHRNTRTLVDQIRRRMPPAEGIPQTADEPLSPDTGPRVTPSEK